MSRRFRYTTKADRAQLDCRMLDRRKFDDDLHGRGFLFKYKTQQKKKGFPLHQLVHAGVGGSERVR